jgi:hypothetical protein
VEGTLVTQAWSRNSDITSRYQIQLDAMVDWVEMWPTLVTKTSASGRVRTRRKMVPTPCYGRVIAVGFDYVDVHVLQGKLPPDNPTRLRFGSFTVR